MKIYFVRHGESVANKEGVFSGRIDVALTEKGFAQAQKAGEKLKDRGISKIYASPLQRAHNTAKEINKFLKKEILINKDLMEMSFGEWEGKKHSEVISIDERILNFDAEENFKYSPKGGESIIDVYCRTSKVYEAIVKNAKDDDNILIVAHGGVINALMSHIVYGDYTGYWKFRIDNCTINMVEIVMGEPVVNLINK